MTPAVLRTRPDFLKIPGNLWGLVGALDPEELWRGFRDNYWDRIESCLTLKSFSELDDLSYFRTRVTFTNITTVTERLCLVKLSLPSGSETNSRMIHSPWRERSLTVFSYLWKNTRCINYNVWTFTIVCKNPPCKIYLLTETVTIVSLKRWITLH